MMHAASLPGLPAQWVVAFPADAALLRPAWWACLLRRDRRHVVAFRALTPGHTLLVNHTGTVLAVEVLPQSADAFAEMLQAQHGAVLLAPPPAAARSGPALRGPMTCVEAVKALLGIRAPFVLTPEQLACHLVRAGARWVVTNAPPAPAPDPEPASLDPLAA